MEEELEVRRIIAEWMGYQNIRENEAGELIADARGVFLEAGIEEWTIPYFDKSLDSIHLVETQLWARKLSREYLDELFEVICPPGELDYIESGRRMFEMVSATAWERAKAACAVIKAYPGTK